MRIWNIHNRISFSHKKGGSPTIVMPWMELKGIMLNEMGQIIKYCTILLVGGREETTKLTEKEIRLVVARGGGSGRGDWRKVVTRYKLPVTRELNPRDLTYNTVTTANHADCMVYGKVGERVNPRNFHLKERNGFFLYTCPQKMDVS